MKSSNQVIPSNIVYWRCKIPYSRMKEVNNNLCACASFYESQYACGRILLKTLCYKLEVVAGSRPDKVNEFFQFT
jgi:hypothetical protein